MKNKGSTRLSTYSKCDFYLFTLFALTWLSDDGTLVVGQHVYTCTTKQIHCLILDI